MTMQHGENGAPLPRAQSRQYGKALCHRHNAESRTSTIWVNQKGRPLDSSGTFEVVHRRKKLIKPSVKD